MYEQRGFFAVRHWWEMERLLSTEVAVSPEDGFSVVPWVDTHSIPVRMVHNAAFVDHWGSVPMDEDAWRKRMLQSPGFRPDLSFVAVADGELIGYAYNEVYEEDWESAGRSEAWIGALGVLRDWRKKGVATALLSKSMQAMRRSELDAAMIGVDSSSPSRAQHLYRSVGFRTTITGTTWQRELT
jgi:ribosomal protein S18 acetylase RimI-like enzyme